MPDPMLFSMPVFRCARHLQALLLCKCAQNREVNIHQGEIAAGTRSRTKPRKWLQMGIDDDTSHDSNVCERMEIDYLLNPQ